MRRVMNVSLVLHHPASFSPLSLQHPPPEVLACFTDVVNAGMSRGVTNGPSQEEGLFSPWMGNTRWLVA